MSAPSPELSPEAIALIKHFEGRRLDAYTDAVGIPTIGYGHTEGVRRGTSITPEEADQYLRFDLNGAQADVLRNVKVPLNSNEYGALVSLAFNIGGPAFARSRCVKLLNKGDRGAAANEIERFCKGHVNGRAVVLRGLELRRQAERELFLSAPGEASKDGYMFLAGQTIPIPPETLPEPPVRKILVPPPPPKRTTRKHVVLAASLGGTAGAVPALNSQSGHALVNEISNAWHGAGGPSIVPAINGWVAAANQKLMQFPLAQHARALWENGAHFFATHQAVAVVMGAVALFMLRQWLIRMRTA